MSFVPLQGRATWVPSHPPRLSEVEFSGPTRTIRMPMRGAIPVLTRAIRVDDAHPSVGLLSGATLLAMKLVAAGRIRLSETGDSWRVGPLQPDDDDRLRALASARAHGDTTVDDAEDLIRQLLDAVADTMARPPEMSVAPPVARRGLDRFDREPEDAEDADLPDQVRISLRIEAPAEVLEGGGVVVVLQAHEVDDDTHVVDADRLWLAEDHGFSRRARFNLSTALRRAATVWPTLDRLQRQQVPDRIVLDADELADLLERGLAALDAAGIDVFWPRGLRGELIPQARVEVATRPQEGPLMDGLFGPGALFEFDWRLALGDDALTDDEMAALAEATTPVIRLRDNWMIIDPLVARRARKRIEQRKKTVPPVVALRSALTGTIDLDGEQVEVHPGASLAEGARASRGRRGGGAAGQPRRPDGAAARLPAARLHLARRAHRCRVGRVPRRRHGPGQDDHPDRAAPAPSGAAARPRPDPGGLPGEPDGQLGGGDPSVRTRCRRTPLPRDVA